MACSTKRQKFPIIHQFLRTSRIYYRERQKYSATKDFLSFFCINIVISNYGCQILQIFDSKDTQENVSHLLTDTLDGKT